MKISLGELAVKHAYVTGATGCVGRNLVDVLQQAGWSITVLHRPSSDLSRLDGCDVAFQPVDLHSLESVRNAIPEGVDAIFHPAGNVSHWSAHADEQWKDNVLATRNLVEAALEKRVGRFIFTSTGAVMLYGEVDEATAKNIKQGYIRTKRLSELEVLKGVERGLDAVITRPIIVVGKYDYNNYARIFRMIKYDRLRIAMPGKIAFCHADDVARAHLSAYEKGRCGERYMLAGPYASWRDFFQEAARCMGMDVKIRAVPKPLFALMANAQEFIARFTHKEPELTSDVVFLLQEVPESFFDAQRLSEQELGYRSASLPAMIKDCYDWLAETGRI
ncbi:MAG: NAD-dependent epimerase/dehydratase family protein [Acidihalobacter sp.]|uniref:NAD-dependent epimerase/dehydratase family protein n=1 Tax=Acidihalobacter sp. TaxID=1872108 RepID=UPI00307E505B